MGDANQNSSRLSMKGQHKKKGGNSPWWIMKMKKESAKKNKGKSTRSHSKKVSNDEIASTSAHAAYIKKTEEIAPSARHDDEHGTSQMSKQARKRKLKRQLKAFKRQQKLRLVRNAEVRRDLDMDQTDKQYKKRKRCFKKMQEKEASKEELRDLEKKENQRKVELGSEGGEKRRTFQRNKTNDMKKKEKKKRDADLQSVKKLQKVDKDGRKIAQKPSNRSVESYRIQHIDRNWKILMKSIYTQPLRNTCKKKVSNSKESKAEIWFDDVDPELLKDEDPQTLPIAAGETDLMHQRKEDMSLLIKDSESAGLTKYIGLDCEMVGIGPSGKGNMLARVSIVNQYGCCIYDKFVAPQEDITDYRTKVTGITAKNLRNADSFAIVQAEVASILKGRILVGHALNNDLKVLLLSHPKSMTRDTSTYRTFKDFSKGKKPKLKKLCEQILKVQIQQGEHNSVQDAQVAMKLFMLYRIRWEKELAQQHRRTLKIRTNHQAETLISTSHNVQETEHARADSLNQLGCHLKKSRTEK